jgi:hypothetical protein
VTFNWDQEQSPFAAGADFAKGVSGAGDVYNVSPTGLGIAPSYLAAGPKAVGTANTFNIVGQPTGTTFPSSPSEGDVYVYLADAVNQIKWAFQYDSTETTYKWVCVGSVPLYAYVQTQETTTSTTYANLATIGPSLVVPLEGLYDIEVGASLSSTTGTARTSVVFSGSAAVNADAVQNGGSNLVSTWVRPTAKVIPAFQFVSLKYSTSAGTGTFGDRRVLCWPRKVTA